MQFIDHESMSSAAFGVPLGEIGMTRWKIVMRMRHYLGIFFRPDEERDHRSDHRQLSDGGERHPHAARRSGLARKWISDQPAYEAPQ